MQSKRESIELMNLIQKLSSIMTIISEHKTACMNVMCRVQEVSELRMWSSKRYDKLRAPKRHCKYKQALQRQMDYCFFL